MLIYYFEFENQISCAVIDWLKSGLGRSDNIIIIINDDDDELVISLPTTSTILSI